MFMLSGCGVEYRLKFDDDLISEEIVIQSDSKEHDEELLRIFDRDYYSVITATKKEPYSKNMIDANGHKKLSYSYDYSFYEFNKSRFLKCYDAYTLLDENDIITFSTSNKFNCLVYDYMDLGQVTISISTDHKVVKSNADEVSGKVHKWHIDSSNASNKPIMFSYKKHDVKKSLLDFLKNNKLNIIIIIGCLGVFAFLTALFIIKSKMANRI